MTDILTETFNNLHLLGEVKYNIGKIKETQIINDTDIDDKIKIVKNIIQSLFTEKEININKIKVHSVLFSLINSNIDLLNKVVYETLFQITSEYSDNYQEYLDIGTEPENVIINLILSFKDFNVKLRKLRTVFKYYGDKVSFNTYSESNDSSFLMVVGYYTFYVNMFECMYMYKPIGDGSLFVSQILCKIINDHMINLDTLIDLFIVVDFYNNMRESISNRDKLFNDVLKDITVLFSDISEKIVADLAMKINSLILNFNKDETNKEVTKEKIHFCAKMGKTFVNTKKKLFLEYCVEALKCRVDTMISDTEIERYTLQQLKSSHCGETIKMTYILADYIKSLEDTKIVRKMKCIKKTDRYSDKIIKTLRHKLKSGDVKYNIIREGVNNPVMNYIKNIPKEIEVYMKIFNTYYMSARHKHRVLRWDLWNSYTVVNYSTETESYKIKMTLPQLMVLNYLKDRSETTPKILHEQFNFSYTDLEFLLNSLLTFKLIIRKNKTTDEIETFIELNSEFSYESKFFSIVYDYVDKNTDVNFRTNTVNKIMNILGVSPCTVENLHEYFSNTSEYVIADIVNYLYDNDVISITEKDNNKIISVKD